MLSQLKKIEEITLMNLGTDTRHIKIIINPKENHAYI